MALQPAGVRLALITPLALVIPTMVVGGQLDFDPIYQAAMFTLLILPPPFIIPLYMAESSDDERLRRHNAHGIYAGYGRAVRCLRGYQPVYTFAGLAKRAHTNVGGYR